MLEDTVLPYLSMYTTNQFRPDQPFYFSCPDMSGVFLNTNCLNLVVMASPAGKFTVLLRDGSACNLVQGGVEEI